MKVVSIFISNEVNRHQVPAPPHRLFHNPNLCLFLKKFTYIHIFIPLLEVPMVAIYYIFRCKIFFINLISIFFYRLLKYIYFILF